MVARSMAAPSPFTGWTDPNLNHNPIFIPNPNPDPDTNPNPDWFSELGRADRIRLSWIQTLWSTLHDKKYLTLALTLCLTPTPMASPTLGLGLAYPPHGWFWPCFEHKPNPEPANLNINLSTGGQQTSSHRSGYNFCQCHMTGCKQNP